ncbi:cupin domain-containing protein [Halorussus sp. MSC15.2]|uniref:cupin domain-containing protein n=1 Tax=Halorussus sp. MSC15.2 TaxID=2283638 RepID=UPI0013D22A19|nr:cupin domain-containing protein [Halorussus sp. MSC15.2]NEU57357.1 cupin domain-containing protein [Halorussus sp. MSC15.2]
MERVAIDAVEARAFGDDAERRGLTEPLGATDVAVNRYRVAPGDGFPGGLHAHADQEEIFLVLDGEATFETLGPEREEAGEVTVAEGEAVRFAPGEYQSGRNAVSEADSDGDDLVALAIGAPRDGEDVRVPLACPECGHGELRPTWDETGTSLVCPDCGAENVPEGCPDCGREMRVTLASSDGAEPDPPSANAETAVVCPDCGARARTPFGE